MRSRRDYGLPSTTEFQREAIVDLERLKPPLVIRRSPQDFDNFDGIDNVVRAQAVARYIDDYYNYVRTVTGVELWKRKPKTTPAHVELHLGEIRVPSMKERDVIGGRATLVFPSVGSVPGANDSFWAIRSDASQPVRSAVAARTPLRVGGLTARPYSCYRSRPKRALGGRGHVILRRA